jgi:hypothetical protein
MDPLARYAARLPTFVTFFFSVIMVTVFREIATIFQWTTAPNFDVGNPIHWLIVISFATTFFFVVAVWLSYALLIERFPYTLDYGAFYFDVVRFSVLFMIFDFSFLAGHPPHYVYYILGLMVFHLLMMGWHARRLDRVAATERPEQVADIRGHGMRAGIYLLLAVVYYFLVYRQWESQPLAAHAVLVLITCALVIFWNARRLLEMKAKAMHAEALADEKKLAEAAAAHH